MKLCLTKKKLINWPKNQTMRRSCFLLCVLLLGLISCRRSQHSGASNGQDELLNENAADEATMLHPRFDGNKLHGLGIFIIGATTENTLGQLINSGKYTFDSIWSHDQQMDTTRKPVGDYAILKITRPLSTMDKDKMVKVCDDTRALWCKQTSTYWISNYVVDSIEIRCIVLTYYKNTLVYIKCGGSKDLKKALSSKFGEPIENHFPDNKDIEGLYTQLPPDYATTFKIAIKGGIAFMNNCSSKDFAEQEATDKANKAKGLKNL
jgi:hypothetical protein